ncbi:NXPE family member 3-like [Pecten maximus]|uniref:NXPE family member 3-like n=1 Tax=Pecten maximus TaxID=6579 RepID=UPI001458B05B|nr:NXPE family member 3-like [Pecten maximus]
MMRIYKLKLCLVICAVFGFGVIYLTTQLPCYKLKTLTPLDTNILQANGFVLNKPHAINETRHVTSNGQIQLDNYLQMKVTNASRFLSPQLTKVTVLPHKVPLRVGDSLRVDIRLFYTDGEPVNTGGDYLRIWLREPGLKANVNGYVTDHGNGTYTGVVLLPWKGHPEVIVTIANSRHHISLIMSYLEKHGTLHTMASKFIDSTGKHVEESVCSPKPDVVLEGCGFADRCNSTQYNYGLPWFCCKPKSEYLTCDDIKTQESREHTTLSKFAVYVARHEKHKHLTSVKMEVVKGEDDSGRIVSPSMPCRKRAPNITWLDNTLSGYYYNEKWTNLKCKTEYVDFKSCLKNKRVVSLGDSNCRALYNIMCERTGAVHLTKHYSKEKPWHKLLMARNTELNIDLMWAPHNSPFYVGPHQPLETMRSVGNWLDRTPHDKPLVVIIHLYYHLTRTTLSVFRAMVKDARAGVDRLLARAPDSKVFIQGPHSITYTDVLEPIDYLHQRHEEIWFQEFMGIHDKVYCIKHWDRTAGMENVNMHPQKYAMADLTNEILTYLCDSHS